MIQTPMVPINPPLEVPFSIGQRYPNENRIITSSVATPTIIDNHLQCLSFIIIYFLFLLRTCLNNSLISSFISFAAVVGTFSSVANILEAHSPALP